MLLPRARNRWSATMKSIVPTRLRAIWILLGVLLLLASAQRGQAQETVAIDANAPATAFPHFWEQMFGSGHAILSLREAWRDDLRAVHGETDFHWVRFHGILDDEVGVFTRDEHGNPVYNYAYVDEIYDGLVKNGVRPLVEISFMPTELAFNPLDLHVFWYHPNVSPPRSMEDWDALMTHLAPHLVERYGIDEVSQWYFEVWNEPNIDFWGGIPREESYFYLYDHTARDLKSVSPRLRVGGPATAAAAWIPDFLKHVAVAHVPIDFVSTHGYADDTVENLFGNDKPVAMDDRVCAAISMVKKEIDTSALPKLPLFWTEWNVEGMNESRDTIFVGPALANTIRECDGQVNEMSFWTFSDVFEEGGLIPRPFAGQFGLRAKGGINKPSFYAFGLLHQLGNERLATSSRDVLATRAADGSLVVAVWNLVDPDQHGTTKTIDLDFRGVPADARVTIQTVDQDHGNVLPKYAAMGSPEDPTPVQVDALNHATALPPPMEDRLRGGRITLTLTPDALDLIRIAQK
jgi:xylan 1,4-beta-xylosidase